MKMRTRSMMDRAKQIFWCAGILFGIWSLGFFKIALIGAVSYFLLCWIIGTITGRTQPEQQFRINPFYPPPAWKDIHDAVWDIFMANANDKDNVVLNRFLHHINAIMDEEPPFFKEASVAIYSKMTYEHQRIYGSLKYTYNGGLHVITGAETLRQLSNEERSPFVAFCQERFAEYLNPYRTTESARPQQTDGRSLPGASV